AAFTTLLPGSVTSNPNPPSPQPQDPGVPATYRIRIVPSPELFFTGTNPLLLLQELLSLGEGRVVAHTDGIPLLSDMDPELCHTYWDVILTTDKGVNSIRDVFIFVEDSVKLTIEEIPLGSDGEEYKRIGEILVERGDVSREEVAKVLAGQRPLGEILVEKGLISPDKVVSALTEQDHVRGLKEKKEKEDQVSSIRVHATKLDTLVDLVGELVTVQARLSAKAVQSNDPDLMLIAEEVERLTEELRDNTMSIRMVPIGTLVHLIRNSIDHGIEIPEERDSLGKPRCGMVNLAARHSGSHVLIEVSDDGKGLDAEVIRAKAIERGLLSPDLELRDKEIFAFLFAPGFSTAEKVTSVSGRGVGMDVVKRTIDSLRGSIDITTEKGTGTTITLKIPLTLAIIEGLLVTIGDGYFVLPLSAVEECIELVHRQGEEANGRRLVTLRDKLVPYIRLREQFTIQGEVPGIEQVVITASGRVQGGTTWIG
ncbi:MAG: chemotaxis protein CheW, partial [Chitinivibrionia bacterium]|nr:chemotaxis protein CheW [Chitinivibrionia bacterium]